MDILVLAALAVVTIVLACKMVKGLRAYNQSMRLQARADYYQARIERSTKQYHIR
jgi:hypothetical protein